MQINLTLILVALLLLGGAVKGWKRGMIKELSALIGLIGALAGVALFLSAAARYRAKDGRGLLAAVLCFLIVVLTYRIIDFIMASLKLLTHLPVLGWLDRLAGIAVGAGEGLLLVWILFLAVTAFDLFGLRGYLLSSVQENPYLLQLFGRNAIAELIARWSDTAASVR